MEKAQTEMNDQHLQKSKKLLEMDPDVSAIVPSGYSNDPVLSNYSEYGFLQAVSKPYRIQELSEALNTVHSKSNPDA